MFEFKFRDISPLQKSKATGIRLMPVLLRLAPVPTAGTIFLMLLAGIGEGIGLTAFAPLLAAAGMGGDDGFSRMFADAIRAIGLEPSIAVLFPLIALLFVGKGIIQFWAALASNYAGVAFGTFLRLRVIGASLRAEWQLFTGQPMGVLANSISTDSGRASAALTAALQFATFSLHVLIYFIISLFVSWQGTLAAIVGGLLLFGSMHYFVQATRRAGFAQQKTFQQLMARLVDHFGMVKPIKAMGAEARLLPYLKADIMGVDETARQLMLNKTAMTTLTEPVTMGLLCLGAWMGIALLELNMAEVLVLAMIFYRAAARISALQAAHQNLVASEGSMFALLDLLNRTDNAAESAGGTLTPSLQKAIDLQGVEFRYGEKGVLEQASLTAPAGKITALIGPSGGGKTTILDLVLGLHKPARGKILVDGQDLRDIDLRQWRAKIGYVPQETILLNDSVANNVTLGDPAISRDAVEGALRAADAMGFVSAMAQGIDSNVGERGLQLSGGQRQRIALARALVRKPLLVVLDEPTSALDPAAADTFLATLRHLATSLTVLIVSHQPEVTKAADVVYAVSNGHVAPRQPQSSAA